MTRSSTGSRKGYLVSNSIPNRRCPLGYFGGSCQDMIAKACHLECCPNIKRVRSTQAKKKASDSYDEYDIQSPATTQCTPAIATTSSKNKPGTSLPTSKAASADPAPVPASQFTPTVVNRSLRSICESSNQLGRLFVLVSRSPQVPKYSSIV